MGKDKLKRFAELETFTNVFQLNPVHKGNWNKNYFKNNQPIVLELGCGRGEYTVSLAKYFPKKNFIGIDIKGARIWRGAKTGMEEHISNMAFLRIEIEQLEEHFSENEVDEIWITFPDPQPQISRERKRLTSYRFLTMYKKVLSPNGIVHLKTDNDGLYAYTLEKIAELNLKLIKHTADLYKEEWLDDVLSIQTTYEKIYRDKGKNINYIQFQF
ncbi:MAG: tRNA (guanosine(46)-N7)-methyltransferase TrmB [Sphingobacteriales bacterium]|nr:tRNA (guanosine(46)-N7)-methyltransferase TrmB [Sphingobacteriales bacterium]